MSCLEFHIQTLGLANLSLPFWPSSDSGCSGSFVWLFFISPWASSWRQQVPGGVIVCGRCLCLFQPHSSQPCKFLAGSVCPGPSTLPQQKQLPRVGCVPVPRPVLTQSIVTSFCPEALGCFLCFHWQSLGKLCVTVSEWPAGLTLGSVLPLLGLRLSQHPHTVRLGQSCEHPRLQGGRGPTPSLAVLGSSSGLLYLPSSLPAAVSPPPGRKGCQQSI